MKIRKGDKVIILSGKDRNKTGIVDRVFTKSNEIIVVGANKVKKHMKVSKKFPAGGVVEIEKPMPVSKVEIICPSCNKATRVGFEIKGKEKVRVCKKCKKEITAPKAAKGKE